MIRLCYLTIFLLYLLTPSSAQRVEALEAQIEEAEEEGNYQKSIELYRTLHEAYAAKQEWANAAEQYLNIGYLYFFQFEEFRQLENYSDSAFAFVQRKEVSPNDYIYSLIWNYYGYYYNHIGDTENAIEAFQQDLAISTYLAEHDTAFDRKELGEAFLNIGALYSQLGDYNQAMDYYQKAIVEFEPTNHRVADTYNNIAYDFQLKKKFVSSKDLA